MDYPYLHVYNEVNLIVKFKNRIFSSFLVREVKFSKIEISQKSISYFWECIENTGN